MKLLAVLNSVNQIEKTSFLKILDGFCSDLRGSNKEVDAILAGQDQSLKHVDNENLVALFSVLNEQYLEHLTQAIQFSDHHIDMVVDILIRDGNALMSRDWFSRLYQEHFNAARKSIAAFGVLVQKGGEDLAPERRRDYLVYESCVRTGYENDLQANRDPHLSWEEKSILHTLAVSLDLSQEEVRALTYSVVPLQKFSIDDVINDLKESGIAFFNRRSQTLFVPDEIVWLLRRAMGIDVATKYVRRVLRHLSDAELNRLAKRHRIPRSQPRDAKVTALLEQGLNFGAMLTDGIFKPAVPKAERSKRIQDLISNDLEADLTRSGRALEDKVANLVEYFAKLERDESSNLSRDGFSRLLSDLDETFPGLNQAIRDEYQLEPEHVMQPEVLVSYGIRPRDVLYMKTKGELRQFCTARSTKSRGNVVANIIEAYRNVDDLFIEKFELLGTRDLAGLRDQGLEVKESEIGVLYERTTRRIFDRLGFNVDEKLRRQLNSKRSKLDILLSIGNQEVIIVECKTVKDRDYNKYASVSRQLQSYYRLCDEKGFRVAQILLIAPNFSDDFISECEYDHRINVSLITSAGLVEILDGYRSSKMGEFPVRLLMKDGLLNASRIVKVLEGR